MTMHDATSVSAEPPDSPSEPSQSAANQTQLPISEAFRTPHLSNELQNFAHLHPTHPKHPPLPSTKSPSVDGALNDANSQERRNSFFREMAYRRSSPFGSFDFSLLSNSPNEASPLSRNPSDTTLVNPEDAQRYLAPPSFFKKNLPYWAHLSVSRKKLEKSKQRLANIDTVFSSQPQADNSRVNQIPDSLPTPQGESASLGATPGEEFKGNETALQKLVGGLFDDAKAGDVENLTASLMAKLDKNNVQPEWLRSSFILTAAALSDICAGNAKQAQQVLERMSQPLDSFWKTPVSAEKEEIEEIEEKAWQCMQRLATVQKSALPAVLQLQGIDPEREKDRLNEYGEGAALIMYLQAKHKLRSFDPKIKAAPYINKSDPFHLVKVLSNPEADQALKAMQAACEVMKCAQESKKNAHDSEEPAPLKPHLTPELRDAYYYWTQGIHDRSTLIEFMSRLVKPFTDQLEYLQERDTLSTYESLKNNLSRVFGRKNTALTSHQLLKKDHLIDHSQSEEYDKAMNDAISSLHMTLKASLPQINEPVQLAEMALIIAKLEMWQTMKGKGYGEDFKQDKRWVKASLLHYGSALIDDRKPLDKKQKDYKAVNREARKLFDKQESQAIRKLTEASQLMKIGMVSVNQIPFLSRRLSKRLEEELFSIASLENLAYKMLGKEWQTETHPSALTGEQQADAHRPALADKLPANQQTQQLHSALFKESIQKAKDLSYNTQVKFKSIDDMEAFYLKMVNQPAGSAILASAGAEAGFSLGFFMSLVHLATAQTLSVGPDIGFTHNGRASHAVGNHSEQGAQITSGKSKELYGRLGVSLLAGMKNGTGALKNLLSASVTAGPRKKLTSIEEASVSLGRAGGKEANEEMVKLFFAAVRAVTGRMKTLRDNADPQLKLDFKDLRAQFFAEELAARFSEKKYSLSFTGQHINQSELALVARLGEGVGPASPSVPTGGISAGMNINKKWANKTLTSKIGTQEKIAQGSSSEFKMDGVWSLGLRFPAIGSVTLRSFINKAIGRFTFRENEQHVQIRSRDKPSDPYSRDFLYEKKVENANVEQRNKKMARPNWEQDYGDELLAAFLKQEQAMPDAKWSLLERGEMNPHDARPYNTLLDLKILDQLAHQERQWQQPNGLDNDMFASLKEWLIIKSQKQVLSQGLKDQASKKEVWQLTGLESDYSLSKEQANGIRLLLKGRHMKGVQISGGKKTLKPLPNEPHQRPRAPKFT